MTTGDVINKGRTAAQILSDSRDVLQPALRAAVDRLPASMRGIAGYHFGWWNERDEPTENSSGKAIRPALALLCAEVVATTASDLAIPAAVAVELVHNFSLLHDDVMDGDLTRRHRPTAWAVYGIGPAILAGDALLSLAIDVLADSGHPKAQEGIRLISAAVLELLDGQQADLSFERRGDVARSECLTMAERKTGALLGASCAIGALFGGADPRRVELLRDFGELVGLAFQFVDDLLGIWGDPAITGKSRHSDLDSRKKSLPVVAALTSNTAAGDALAKLYHQQAPLSAQDLIRAAELVDLAGGRDWSQAMADDLLAQALGQLRAASQNPKATAELTTLAALITRRDH
ncbi:MAG TPA: family 2 encapsulin nanocompartment cargo protein polyprenyl transferase [Pseudonocardiaceae bacterium]|nr:family 2 encapsulin nanocompartment cargo protein polyprenyl transferase [Pseudonocardiaceae bacterium]